MLSRRGRKVVTVSPKAWNGGKIGQDAVAGLQREQVGDLAHIGDEVARGELDTLGRSFVAAGEQDGGDVFESGPVSEQTPGPTRRQDARGREHQQALGLADTRFQVLQVMQLDPNEHVTQVQPPVLQPGEATPSGDSIADARVLHARAQCLVVGGVVEVDHRPAGQEDRHIGDGPGTAGGHEYP